MGSIWEENIIELSAIFCGSVVFFYSERVSGIKCASVSEGNTATDIIGLDSIISLVEGGIFSASYYQISIAKT